MATATETNALGSLAALDDLCWTLGIRDKELAGALGVDRSTVWRWRRGELEPTPAQLERLREAVLARVEATADAIDAFLRPQ